MSRPRGVPRFRLMHVLSVSTLNTVTTRVRFRVHHPEIVTTPSFVSMTGFTHYRYRAYECIPGYCTGVRLLCTLVDPLIAPAPDASLRGNDSVTCRQT